MVETMAKGNCSLQRHTVSRFRTSLTSSFVYQSGVVSNFKLHFWSSARGLDMFLVYFGVVSSEGADRLVDGGAGRWVHFRQFYFWTRWQRQRHSLRVWRLEIGSDTTAHFLKENIHDLHLGCSLWNSLHVSHSALVIPRPRHDS